MKRTVLLLFTLVCFSCTESTPLTNKDEKDSTPLPAIVSSEIKDSSS